MQQAQVSENWDTHSKDIFYFMTKNPYFFRLKVNGRLFPAVTKPILYGIVESIITQI